MYLCKPSRSSFHRLSLTPSGTLFLAYAHKDTPKFALYIFLLSRHPLKISLFLSLAVLSSMARSISQTLTLTRHLSAKSSPPSSSRLINLRAQSTLPFHHDPPSDSSADSPSDPLLRKLEDAIHRIIVRRSAPDWLPFLPGASYWVPPPRSRSHGLAQLVDKLANPLSEEETMSMTTVRGWPSSAYFIEGTSPQLMEPVIVVQSSDDVPNPQPTETGGQSSDNVSKSEDEEG